MRDNENGSCFMQLHFGVVCYTALDARALLVGQVPFCVLRVSGLKIELPLVS